MISTPGITVVIMAYNEAESVGAVAREILHEVTQLGRPAEVIIVDDGSTDGTARIADELAAESPTIRCVHHPRNAGLGGVYRTGFQEARYDYLTFFPADGQFPPAIIGQFLARMEQADLVLGYLPDRQEPVWKKLLSLGERLLYGILFGGFPRFQGILMFRRRILDEVPLTSTGRGWAVLMELILRARRRGFRLLSVPTELCPRRAGRSKVGNWGAILSNLRQVFDLHREMSESNMDHAPSHLRVWPLVAILVIAGLHFATLLRYPAAFVDEAWFGSRAWAFRETHMAFGPLDRGVFDRFPGYWTFFPLLPTVLQAVALSGSAQPELAPLRILSLLAGCVLLAGVFSFTRSLAGDRAAWLAMSFVALSRPFVFSAHLARYDIFVSALGFAAMALACRQRSDPAGLADPAKSSVIGDLGAGLCVGTAFEIHPSGCLYGPVVLLLYLFRRPLHKKQVLSFILGNLVALGMYALLHVVRYPQTWMTLSRLAGSVTHKPPLATLDPWTLIDSFIGTLRLAFDGSPILLPIALLAVLLAAMQSLPVGRPLNISFWGLLVAFALLMQHKLLYYNILFSPVIEIAAAYLLGRLRTPSWQRILGAVCGVYAVAYALLPLSDDLNQDFRRIRAELPAHVRAGETIMGSQTWWFALYNHPWYSWEELLYFQRYRPGSNLEVAFREFRPSILLIDQHLSYFISEGGAPGSYAEQLRLPESEMRAILRKYGRIRAELDGGEYGRIFVVEFDWDRT